jgi:hypothetical protein
MPEHVSFEFGALRIRARRIHCSTFGHMKVFYICTLAMGFFLGVCMQFADYALPKDAYVAAVLSESPNSWTISVEKPLEPKLRFIDTKRELTNALHKRSRFYRDEKQFYLLLGTVLVSLSVIGLVRESKLSSVKKPAEPDAAVDGGKARQSNSNALGPPPLS